MSREEILTSLLIAELRFVSKNRRKLLFKLVADVDDETGPDVVVQGGVDNLERPVGSEGSDLAAGLPAIRGLESEVQLHQSRQKAGFITENRRGVMIWVPSLPVRQNHHARPRLTDDVGNLQSVLQRVLNA